jgi:PilZ domain.
MATKVYVDFKGIVIFVCPNCGDLQKENAETYKNVAGPIKIQCKCGNTYDVQIEFRTSYRKEATLEGRYSTLSNPGKWARIIIKNLSFEGCGFETMAANMLHSDEEIRVEFKLDDIKNSQIKKRAVVRSVQGPYVGCKFKELPGAFDPDLGFYLR